MNSLIGTTLANRYQISDLLGEGGMGGVYKAQDRVLQVEVALKVQHERLTQQGDFRQRFLQEARTAARLNHPGLVRVFVFGRADGLLYIRAGICTSSCTTCVHSGAGSTQQKRCS